MVKRIRYLLQLGILMLIGGILLTACNNGQAASTQDISSPESPTSTAPPSATPTLTPVPLPATATPTLPTATPLLPPATATPAPSTATPSPEISQTEVGEDNSSAHRPIPLQEWSQLELDALHEQVFAALLKRDPERATDLGLADQYGIGEGQLTDVSEAYQQQTYQLIADSLDILRNIDETNLTSDQIRSNQIFIWDLENRLQDQPFSDHHYPVRQLFSPHTDLPSFMAFTHPLDTRQNIEDFIKRLRQFPIKFEQINHIVQRQAELDILPPSFVFEIVLGQLQEFIAVPPDQNLIYSGFKARLAETQSLNPTEKQQFQMAVIAELENSVYPAYQTLADTLENLKPRATTDDGVWKLPDGEAYYAHTLGQHTTTNLTAEEIHAIGQQEVERIQQKIQAMLTDMGYSADLSSGARQFYQDSPVIIISNDDDRAEAITAYQDALAQADKKLGHLFNLQPISPLEVQRTPEFQQGSAAYYTAPPLDGTRPGIFFVPLDEGAFVFIDGVPTLAHHEGIPGHHFQLAIQKEAHHLPTFRRALEYTAFTEGWALYTERLAAEQGLYDDNPRGELAHLIQSDIFRAARLVVDTGIHHFGWSREEAQAYMTEATGFPWASEVDRYIVWPGQATGYKIGELTILRLRDEAQTALGDQFDLAEFHTVILQNGNVPLTILDEIVQDYIEQKRLE